MPRGTPKRQTVLTLGKALENEKLKLQNSQLRVKALEHLNKDQRIELNKYIGDLEAVNQHLEETENKYVAEIKRTGIDDRQIAFLKLAKLFFNEK